MKSRKEYQKEYYKKNKKKSKEYYKKNKEKSKEYYKKNKEKSKEYYKKYYLDNKEKISKYGYEYRERPEYISKREEAYQKRINKKINMEDFKNTGLCCFDQEEICSECERKDYIGGLICRFYRFEERIDDGDSFNRFEKDEYKKLTIELSKFFLDVEPYSDKHIIKL